MSEWIAALSTSPIAVSCCVALLALTVESTVYFPAKYHPLSAARLLARKMDRKVRPRDDNAKQQNLISGTLAYLVLFAPMLLVMHLLLALAEIRIFFDTLVLWVALSFSPERQTYHRIERALKSEKKVLARQWLSLLVKRDTQSLSDIGIAKATMESLVLRFVYQVLSPLFLFFAFGPLAALAYRLILTCYWEWQRPQTAQNTFALPASLICKICQFVPSLIFTVLVWLFVMPRSTRTQGRDLVKIQTLRWSAQRVSPLLLHSFAKRLGFSLGGPLQYAGVRYRLPRYGAAYQVRLSDMIAARHALATLLLVIGLAIVVTLAATTLS